MTLPAAPVLTADGLELRPWRLDDADEVLVIADDEQSRRWSPSMRTVRNRAEAVRWIEGRIASPTHWAVVDTATGRLAGRAGLHHVDADDRSGEIGYGVSPAFRRRGVALRVVGAVGRYAFAPPPHGLGLVRVTLRHVVGNQASCRVAGAAGYAFEGVSRGSVLAPDRSPEDEHVHARLAGDPAGPLARVVPAEPVEIVAGAYQLCVPDAGADAAAVVAAGADPDIARWNATPTDLAEARAWCLRRADWTAGDHASWVVKAATGGELLGSISLFEVDAANSSCQAGYWVVPAARGHGVATAALSAAARFAFGALGLERVELFHAVENPASCAVATRAGFALEGVHRASYRYGDGLLHDEHSHARLAGDPDRSEPQG